MKKQIYLADRFAGTDEPVLINGESGSGISMLAESIHKASVRRDGPFVRVYAWVYEKEHFEKQFFGQEADWSGDVTEKPGLVEKASGGTLLLRKVGAISKPAQMKLLALLQTGRYRRHGVAQEREADFRLITASRSDLLPRVEAGDFVEDLLVHINTNHLAIPPLRERSCDIIPLAEHFLRLAKDKGAKPVRLSQELVDLLMEYRWPGNVSELKEMIEDGAITEQQEELGFHSLSPIARGRLDPEFERGEHLSKPWTLKEVEKEHIRKMLRLHEGDLAACAETLGISYEDLKSKVENGD
jgi:DNA-binding NtrC family response regulator